jgi:hypothetical protein
MQARNRSEELLRQLSTAVTPVEDPALAAARRERVVARLTQVVPEAAGRAVKRARLRRFVAMASAAAAVLALSVAAARLHSAAERAEIDVAPSTVVALEGSVQLVQRATEIAAPPREKLAVGSADEVVTGSAGRARASLASGAEIDIDPDSRVRLRGDDAIVPSAQPAAKREAVLLGRGRVLVRVPKLGPSRTFAVETPEATVVVHGTVFAVARGTSARGEPLTSVDVSEGVVSVHHRGVEILLRAGGHWSSESAREDETASRPNQAAESAPSAEVSIPETAPAKPKSALHRRRSGSVAKGATESAEPERNSSLAEENRLLKAAMSARQQGDTRRAAELAAELAARFPGSPLVEEARVERMRALAGSPAGASEARSYLADYPRGFARDEANRLLGSSPR